MKIKATPVKMKDLKPGDLFGIPDDDSGAAFFENPPADAICMSVALRESAPLLPDEGELEVFRLEVEREEEPAELPAAA